MKIHMSKNNKLSLYFWYSLAPLLVGIIVYLMVGSMDTFIYKMASYFIGHDILLNLRMDIALTSVIQNHLADGLWAFSLTSTLVLVFHQAYSRQALLLIAIFSLVGFELAQHLSWIHGTADIYDLVIMVLCAALAFFITTKKQPYVQLLETH